MNSIDMNSIDDRIKLNNKVRMPWLGFGVFKMTEEPVLRTALEAAFSAGYRSIDTASYYHNEHIVGRAIRESGIPREELFITTKVWNTEQGYLQTKEAFERSRERLDIETIDLYLIHWPVADTFHETWRAMEELYGDGKVKAIGVSNFDVRHLEELSQHSQTVPAVNQIEFHPYLLQPELHGYCKSRKIRTVAWGPLMRGKALDNPVISRIAEKYGKTPAQIILRWDLEHQVITIPKSSTPARIKENTEIFDFSLEDEDIQAIDALDRNERLGPGPDDFEEYLAKAAARQT